MGQFGDYVGGILNPLIAFGAFYWLATSIVMQERELVNTRRILVDSQKEHRKQALTALHTARLQTLNIHLSVSAQNLARLEAFLQQVLLHQGVHGTDSPYWDAAGDMSNPAAVIKSLRGEVSKAAENLNRLIAEIDALSAKFKDEYDAA